MSKFLKIGHRGVKGHVVENTIPSILKAIEFGVDGIEIDVHKCKSGELVVFHDFTLDRLTSGTGEISKFTLKELKALTILEQFKIPTLTEVLDVIDRKCIINIELKGLDTALETVSIIENYIQKKEWKYHNFIVSSFQKEELKTVFSINKNIQLGVLTKACMEETMAFAETIDALAIHANFSLLTKENVEKAQAKGFKINTWTVNRLKDIERIKTYNINAIISDFPDRL